MPEFPTFKVGGKLAGGSARAVLPEPLDPEVLDAYLADEPFPARDLDPSDFKVAASGAADLKLAAGDAAVSFSGRADAHAGIGLFRSAADVAEHLEIDHLGAGEPAEDSVYLVLHWGYDVGIEGAGTVALGGPGKVGFTAGGERTASYHVVRRLPADTPAQKAVRDLFRAFRLPASVEKPADLPFGTWLVADVDGGFEAGLNGTLGYDLTWIRKTRLGDLSGDIGLRLQLGLQASFGFSVEGRMRVVLEREEPRPPEEAGSGDPSASDDVPLARLRLFRRSRRGWDFAFNLTARAQARPGDLLPGEADDFIRGALGVHGTQVMRILDEARHWSQVELDRWIAGELAGHAGDLLTALASTTVGTELLEAREELLGVLKRWHALPEKLTSYLFHVLGREEVEEHLDEIRSVLETLKGEGEVGAKLDEIASRIADPNDPALRLVEALLGDDVVKVLSRGEEALRDARVLAREALALLDDGEVEARLRELHGKLTDQLSLDRIEKAVKDANPEALGALLERRLAEFLDRDVPALDDLREIQDGVERILELKDSLYARAREAATREYGADLAYRYQKTTTREALLDASFHLEDAIGPLGDALDGRLDAILTEKIDGVTLHAAALTHGVERARSVSVSLPFVDLESVSASRTLARLKVSDHDDDGRLLLYDLEAERESVRQGAELSRLAVTGGFTAGLGRTRTFSTRSLGASFVARQGKEDLRTAQVRNQLRPFIQTFFEGRTSALGHGFSDAWVDEMDDAIDQREHNGPGVFGDTLLALRLALAPETLAGWAQAPDDEDDPRYQEMSKALQRSLKTLLPMVYFADPGRYGRDRLLSQAMLIYASVPPALQFHIRAGRFREGPGLHWFRDHARHPADNPLLTRVTPPRISENLARAHEVLSQTEGFEDEARHWKADRVGSILTTALEENSLPLRNLFRYESDLVESSRRAARDFVRFRREMQDRPAEALSALVDFGEELTKAFHDRVTLMLRGAEEIVTLGRSVGLLLMASTGRALAGEPADVATSHAGMLDLIVLKDAAPLALPAFLEGRDPPVDDVLIRQRIVVG